MQVLQLYALLNLSRPTFGRLPTFVFNLLSLFMCSMHAPLECGTSVAPRAGARTGRRSRPRSQASSAFLLSSARTKLHFAARLFQQHATPTPVHEPTIRRPACISETPHDEHMCVCRGGRCVSTRVLCALPALCPWRYYCNYVHRGCRCLSSVIGACLLWACSAADCSVCSLRLRFSRARRKA